MFWESAKFALAMAVSLLLVDVLLRSFLRANAMFIHYMLVISAVLPSLRPLGSLRQLRALPISLNGVAFIILALSLVNFATCLAILLAANATIARDLLDANPASLFLTAAMVPLATSLTIRFGPMSLPAISAFSIVTLFWLQVDFITKLPTSAYLGISGAMMVAAAGILRSALRSSGVYRVPAGNLAAG